MPKNNPAFGFAAVPLPMKIPMKSTTGLAPTAVGPAGSPEATAAAAGVRDPFESNSRRMTAAAVHINGPAAGTPPSPAPPSHDNTFAPTPDTDPRAAAVITGTDAAAAGSIADAEASARAAPDVIAGRAEAGA